VKQPDPKIRAIAIDQVQACMDRVERVVAPEDFAILHALLEAYRYVLLALSATRVSVARLRRVFLGSRTEKGRSILPKPPGEGTDKDEKRGASGAPGESGGKKNEDTAKAGGHGRNGVAAYGGADRIALHLEGMYSGCPCPDENCTGKVYPLKKPREILRIIGQPALMAKVWELHGWRCNLCEEIFRPDAPPEATGPKYDETAVVMLAILHFGNGFAFHRLERYQAQLEIPLPASTQSEILTRAYQKLRPVLEALIWHAAQCGILHSDDTGMKVLALLAQIREAKERAPEDKKMRTGIHTSGIVAIAATYQISLYFTGLKHAGENLTQVLEKRKENLLPPIHVSDGLGSNKPGKIPVEESKCLTHGRRQFVDIVDSFPKECGQVVELIGEVYRVDAVAKRRNLSDEDRLLLHQEKSGPVMAKLRRWLEDQLLGEVEPNSSLGRAIVYMLKRWKPLTLFLRKPGVPLDNNIVERALKKAIRHRRNSLFFKTQRGAAVGDLFMSLIETCILCGVNPFQYLVDLLRNIDRVQKAPRAWMPWNYQAAMKARMEIGKELVRVARPPLAFARSSPPAAGALHANAPVT